MNTTPAKQLRMPLAWISRDGKLIILGRGLRTYAQGMLAVVSAIYLDKLGFSVVQIGAFITIGLTGTAIYSFLISLFAGAVGQRRLLVLFTLASVAAGVALALFGTFPALALTFFFTSLNAGGGANQGPVQPLEQSSLAGSTTPQRRTDMYAVYNIVSTAGMALGALSAGLPQVLQEGFGVEELASFKVLMLVFAGFNIIAAVCFALLSDAVETPQVGQKWTNPLKLPSRRVIFTLSGLFAVDFFAGGLLVQSLVSLWFYTRFGVQLGSIALIFFTAHILSAASLWVAAKLANRFGLINTMVFTHIPASLLLIVLPFAPSAALAVLVWQVRAFFSMMDVPTRQSYTMAVVGPEERVAMASINAMTRSVIVAGSPSIAGLLWSVASASVPFVVTGVLKIAYDVALWVTFRNIKTPEETARVEAKRRKADGTLHSAGSPQTRL